MTDRVKESRLNYSGIVKNTMRDGAIGLAVGVSAGGGPKEVLLQLARNTPYVNGGSSSFYYIAIYN